MLEVRIFGDVHCASSDVRVTHLCLRVEWYLVVLLTWWHDISSDLVILIIFETPECCPGCVYGNVTLLIKDNDRFCWYQWYLWYLWYLIYSDMMSDIIFCCLLISHDLWPRLGSPRSPPHLAILSSLVRRINLVRQGIEKHWALSEQAQSRHSLGMVIIFFDYHWINH